MAEQMTVQDVDRQIRKQKAKIKELQKLREKVIQETTLYPEKLIFTDGGFNASEKLRRSNPIEYASKCDEVGFGEDRVKYGLTRQHHVSKCEIASIKACYHASNRRAKYPIHLTADELKLAKIYMMSYAKEWIEFWKGDIKNESWKKN